MTRQDFDLLAGAIRSELEPARERRANGSDARSRRYGDAGVAHLERLARRMAELLADDNGRFDRARWLEACGVEPDR